MSVVKSMNYPRWWCKMGISHAA